MTETIKWIYESTTAKLERAHKRLFILAIVFMFILVANNCAWLVYVDQFDVEETVQIDAEQQADGDSNNYIIGGDYGGQTESDSDQD